jgi:hypothetical protein
MDQHFTSGQPTTGVDDQPPQLPGSLIEKTVRDTADAAIVRLNGVALKRGFNQQHHQTFLLSPHADARTLGNPPCSVTSPNTSWKYA